MNSKNKREITHDYIRPPESDAWRELVFITRDLKRLIDIW
jgi:hypothetical protein